MAKDKASGRRSLCAGSNSQWKFPTDDAVVFELICPLKSVGLQKLKGDRKDQWAMTVNERWRICFEFRKGDAYEVEVDYHRG
jgi:plasmid maintenance system killer protein